MKMRFYRVTFLSSPTDVNANFFLIDCTPGNIVHHKSYTRKWDDYATNVTAKHPKTYFRKIFITQVLIKLSAESFRIKFFY